MIGEWHDEWNLDQHLISISNEYTYFTLIIVVWQRLILIVDCRMNIDFITSGMWEG